MLAFIIALVVVFAFVVLSFLFLGKEANDLVSKNHHSPTNNNSSYSVNYKV